MAKLKGGTRITQVLATIGANASHGELLCVGFLSGATYPDAPPRTVAARYAKRHAAGNMKAIKGAESGTMNVATVAAFMEFGTSRIPPRPFFRNMIRTKSHEWGPALGADLVSTGYNVRRSLDRLGQGVAGQLRQSIVDTNAPPLAPSTIAKKGFSKPLVDSDHMLQSIDSEVS